MAFFNLNPNSSRKLDEFRQVLDLIFERCASLQTLDVSWSGEFSDAPWSRAPVTCHAVSNWG
jgi:hypothetical protein